MKKLFIITLFTTLSYSQNKFKQAIELETSNLMFRSTLDTKYIISDKLYVSNWSTYSFGDVDRSFSLAPYMVSQTFINKKINNRLTLSIGHEYLRNIEFKDSFNFVKAKVRFEIFK